MRPRLSERGLMNIGATHPKGRTQWAINPRDGEAIPSITFQTQPNGVQYLTARQSLPRIRYGHNATLPASQIDIYAELALMADAIYKRTGIEFNPLTANVTGVHFTRDIYVGRELIAPTLTRLEPRQLPRYRRIRFDHGIEYKQKGASILIYSKHHEMHQQIINGTISKAYHADALQACDGVLRIESRHALASLNRLQQAASKTRQGKDVLTPELSNQVIGEFLNRLQFDGAVNNAESNKALDRLIEVHGSRVAIRLYGFLTMARSYGKDFWRIEVLDYPRKTYFTNLRLCRTADVWDV